MTFDPETHRRESRERWEAAAHGWAGAEWFARATIPVSEALVAAADPKPGETVLELASGRGDTGLLAARLIEPGGKLICTDGAEAMVPLAELRAKELGIVNAEFKPMDLEWIDAPTASIDVTLCRFGYMHAVDPEASLRETRRALKPSGRVALSVWTKPAENPWLAAPAQALQEIGEGPGAFALSGDDQVHDLLLVTGFEDVATHTLDLIFEAPSLDAMWDAVLAMSSTLGPAARGLAPAEHYAAREAVDSAWASYVRGDGGVAIPGRALIARASA